ncbi:MAG: YjbQ family protein [Cyanobacteria bacterium SBLK]|nr:YjbQ family protein [Cyanobacteria bacterium SBLK]
MQFYQKTLRLETQGNKSLFAITARVREIVTESQIQAGLCNIFLRHTSASLLIQEQDAVPDVERFFNQLVPETDTYLLAGEGADDMPSHIRSALTHTSEQIPIAEGKLAMGRLQDLYIWEHRQAGQTREVIVSILGL